MSTFLVSSSARSAVGAIFVGLLTLAAMQRMTVMPDPVINADGCPAGYEMRDPLSAAEEFNERFAQAHEQDIRQKFGAQVCMSKLLMPESMAEVAERQNDAAAIVGAVPQGAPRRALEQKAALQLKAANVPNASGHWQDYGTAPQVQDEAYPDGSADGITQVSGRTDGFAWDPDHQRLFAAVGNGGIWYSQAEGGDLSTLGNHWTNIGNKLPTQINSTVAWTPARGGRVLVLSGEHTQGGNSYVGLGAYWSDDLGANWHHATGVPDGALSFKITVDQSNPDIVYAASGKGLFRSTDAGASYVNVRLPVSADCAGSEGLGKCQFANFVTDVAVKQPGGTTSIVCDPKGCPVLAAVGFRSGIAPYPDGTAQSPGNGLYRSDTGERDTYANVGTSAIIGPEPIGFTLKSRIGRIELGNAIGDAQNHDYVYAMVQDAGFLNGGAPILDFDLDIKDPKLPIPCAALNNLDPSTADLCTQLLSKVPSPTNINGIFVSSNFGDTWIRLADDIELTYNLTTSSSLAPVVAIGNGPGIQTWYDQWIRPDPTQALAGAPTRLLFGMEEIWKNRLNIPQIGVQQTPDDYFVIGTYFAGQTCLFLIGNAGLPSLPVCPTYPGLVHGTTTHPDQHDGIFIPDPASGGVWVFAGNDGGIYKQFSGSPLTDDFANNKWGDGVNNDRYTLMVYGIAVAKDGTVYYGLQDNASGKIEPDTRRSVRIYIGDGMWTAVDPDNSQNAYYSTPGLAVVASTDGGKTNSSIYPANIIRGTAHFLSPFSLDPTDANHLVMAGSKVAEAVLGSATTSTDWVTLFDLGADASGALHQTRSRALDVRGDAIYAGWCGPCNLAGTDVPFQRGIATNIGGDKPPARGTSDGWHQASMIGLPNRYIYNVAIDPTDVRTIYVALGGYSTARWAPPGQYLDANAGIGSGHIFVSHDAGEHFTNASGDLPDTIASFVLRRGNQLIAGTDIGAFISSDLTGANWAPLGDLPNVPINQLVLKPGDDNQLFAATFGRGVQQYKFDTAGVVTPPAAVTEQEHGRFGGAMPAPLLLVLLLGALRRRRS